MGDKSKDYIIRLAAEVGAKTALKEFEARLFRLLRRLGEPIEQVPIRTVYVANNRASHFHPLRDTLLTQAALFFDFK